MPKDMKSATIHNQKFELYSWDEFGQHLLALSREILKSGDQFDRLVALAKGGTAIARPLGDLCGIKEQSSVQIEFYADIAETNKTPVITQSLPVQIKGERVLVVDDIADSGETLKVANTYLSLHGVDDIKTATLITKPWTKFKPDYSFYHTDSWIIFPWEVRETIELLTAIWKQKGDRQDKIKAQLVEIGFPKTEIDFYYTE